MDSVVVAREGAVTLNFLHRQGNFTERPVAVWPGIKMPRVDGLEVLSQVKSDLGLKSIPVAGMASPPEQRDLAKGYDPGVNACAGKPVKFSDFLETVSRLGVIWGCAPMSGRRMGSHFLPARVHFPTIL